MVEKSFPNTRRWLQENTRFADRAEMITIQLGHPTMQIVLQAIDQLKRATQDLAWIEKNDPNRELKDVIRTLVSITSLYWLRKE